MSMTSTVHIKRTNIGESFVQVRLVDGNTPPVLIDVTDNATARRSHIGGYLSYEAAELLRRALNDLLGPMQAKREADAAHERALEVARASRSETI